MSRKLVFLCGARDFHAMDWYKSAIELLGKNDIYVVTDLIAGEGYKKIVSDKDKVIKLVILDPFLFKKQSRIGHIWRNILKLLVFPIQVVLLRKFYRKNLDSLFHAHSMYYLFLAWAAKVPYVGTPQGSDVLIKPYSSKIYRYFAQKSMRAANAITVDSEKMREKVYELTRCNAIIIQNGIDLSAINEFTKNKHGKENERFRLLSIRGFTPLYRIKEIFFSRNQSMVNQNKKITLIYPFSDDEYVKEVLPYFNKGDQNIGRLDRNKMYELLFETNLVISIPVSDSSPRSVYEAIFCGSAVAITYHKYYEILPDCMKKRIVLVDLNNLDWLDTAIEEAKKIAETDYNPSEEALDLFDQKRSFMKMEQIYSLKGNKS